MLSNSSSPPSQSLGQKPPASQNALMRTMEAPARMPSSAGPGSQPGAGTGDPLNSGTIGSSQPPGSTMIRPVTAASPSWASRMSAARLSAPGSHQTSSSQKATYEVRS